MLGAPVRKFFEVLRRVRFKPFPMNTEENRAHERDRRAAMAGLASLAGRVVSVGVQLVSVRIALQHLGEERYGLWMTLTGLASLAAFADLGLGHGLLNGVASSEGKGQRDKASYFVSSAYFVVSAIALLLAIASIGAAFIPEWVKVFRIESMQARNEVLPTIFAFIVCTFTAIPLSLIARIQGGYQEGAEVAGWALLGTLIGFVFQLLSLRLELALQWVVFGTMIGPILSNLIATFHVMIIRRPYLRPRVSNLRMDAMRELGRVGVLFFVLQLTTSLIIGLDNFIVTRIVGLEEVASFSVAARLFSLVNVIAFAIMAPLWPAFTEAAHRGDKQWIRSRLVTTSLVSAATSGAISLGLLLFHEPLLQLWLGDVARPTFAVLASFAVWSTVWNSMVPVAMFLNGTGIIKEQIILSILFATSSLALKWYFSNALGTVGIVWANILSFVFFSAGPMLVLLPRFFLRIPALLEPDSV